MVSGAGAQQGRGGGGERHGERSQSTDNQLQKTRRGDDERRSGRPLAWSRERGRNVSRLEVASNRRDGVPVELSLTTGDRNHGEPHWLAARRRLCAFLAFSSITSVLLFLPFTIYSIAYLQGLLRNIPVLVLSLAVCCCQRRSSSRHHPNLALRVYSNTTETLWI